ncbi:CotH kinase family protein [Neobacillus sp. GCM10023253]|uniref:CotH kinase family protein n=1 Tax=Neobacillus sp. GCM10023253 TaxID=3252644 RepID=UPI00360C0EF5
MDQKRELPVYMLSFHRWDLQELSFPLRPYDDPVPGNLYIEDMKFSIATQFRGNYTKKLPKRSYFVQLQRPQLLNGARELHLNAEYKDPSSIRNKLSLDLFQVFGVLSPRSQHVRLYLNGHYEGVYLHLESVDDLFFKKRGLQVDSIYYAVKPDADFSLYRYKSEELKESLLLGYQRKFGTTADDCKLTDFINIINNTPHDKFEEEISKHLDVEKYLRWLAVAVCTQNYDGFKKNYALYRNPETQLFEILPWDYDGTFGRDWDAEIIKPDSLSINGKNHLTKKLLECPAFRKQYRALMEELLDTLFTPDYFEPIITSLTESIRPYLLFTNEEQREIFDGEKDFMLSFIKERNRYLRNLT